VRTRSEDTASLQVGVEWREAPVGIEPTNRGFAAAQERLRTTLSRSV